MSNPIQALADKSLAKLNAGDLTAALKLARTGAKKHPKVEAFPKIAAAALVGMEDHKGAVPFLAKAYKLDPADIEVRRNLGFALASVGETAKADGLIDRWLSADPDNPHYHYVRAYSLTRQGQFDGAEQAATRAIDAGFNLKDALGLRAFARLEQAKWTAALEDCNRIAEIDPYDIDALTNKSICLRELRQDDQSLAAVDQALSMSPDTADLHAIRAEVLLQLGRLDDATDAFDKVLSLDPNNVLALTNLAQTGTDADNVEKRLQSAIKATPATSEDKALLQIALGNYLFRCKRYADSARAFDTANATRAKSHPYDADRAEATFERMTALHPDADSLRSGGDADAPTPIFVIGQPRSGTTLTDMIVSAHPEVQSFGELGIMATVAEKVMAGDDLGPAEMVQLCRDRIPPLKDPKPYFVDKTPMNYQYVGLLMETFPKAKFISIERDPREVALSMWRQHLKGTATYFTSRTDWMAHSANLYRRYMTHWNALFGDRILTVQYRDLVSDVETETKRIAAYCGLDWVPEMMSPEKNAAQVRTASIRQVRQKVNTGSIGKWKVLEQSLQPFIDRLDPALWPDLDTD